MYLDVKPSDIAYLSEQSSGSSSIYTWLESWGQISPGSVSKSLDTAVLAVGVFQERPNRRRNVVVVMLCEVSGDGEPRALDECGIFLMARDCFNVTTRPNVRLSSAELARVEGILHDFGGYICLSD
jgi:hypothetical protein